MWFLKLYWLVLAVTVISCSRINFWLYFFQAKTLSPSSSLPQPTPLWWLVGTWPCPATPPACPLLWSAGTTAEASWSAPPARGCPPKHRALPRQGQSPRAPRCPGWAGAPCACRTWPPSVPESSAAKPATSTALPWPQPSSQSVRWSPKLPSWLPDLGEKRLKRRNVWQVGGPVLRKGSRGV